MEYRGKVLIVEDDRDLVDLLSIHLRDLGFSVEHADEGMPGLRKSFDGGYALIILDLMLPGFDGLEICRRVREKDKSTPILMLTAKSEEIDKIVGLELGADDYITKPFSIREFVARVKAITRRMEEIRNTAGRSDLEEQVQFGELILNRMNRRVSVAGKRVELTAREYELLNLFASNPGRAFSRQQLLDLVWGYQYEGYSHTVNSHINRLRNKIETDSSNPRYIKTVWGFGYRFVAPGEPE